MLTYRGVTLVYDGDGNRVSESIVGTTTKYLVDTLNPTGLLQVLDETVSGTVGRTLTGSKDRREPEGRKRLDAWLLCLRRTRECAISRKCWWIWITDSYNFDAFGIQIEASAQLRTVFLQWRSLRRHIGRYDLRARYLNQATGRFWTRDAIEGRQCCNFSWNPYIYVWDDPVMYFDPLGEKRL